MLFDLKFTVLSVCRQFVDLLLITSGTPRVYTVAISVGHNNQNMNIQVDMGSSDLVGFVLFRLFTSFIWTDLSSPYFDSGLHQNSAVPPHVRQSADNSTILQRGRRRTSSLTSIIWRAA